VRYLSRQGAQPVEGRKTPGLTPMISGPKKASISAATGNNLNPTPAVTFAILQPPDAKQDAAAPLIIDRRPSLVDLLGEVTRVIKDYEGVFYPHSKLATTFDNYLAVLLLFTATITPFEIAYLEQKINALFVLNRIIDIGFICDIAIQFRVARFDREQGVWITDRRRLFWMYLRSTFVIDFCSTVPWDLLGFVINVEANVKLMRLLKLMKMAKLVRIYKSSKIFKKMKSKFHLKVSERIQKHS
jgi:potassium voltage-gated channel Eag-related subfamily H protein 7